MKKLILSLIASTLLIFTCNIPASATAWLIRTEEYGTCRVTAYSGNNGVTYGASGNTLVPNVSVAASRNIPLGTELYIKGFGIVTVEDRMAKWYDDKHDGMVIDLYLESYEAACDWGVHELEVYIITDKKEIKCTKQSTPKSSHA